LLAACQRSISQPPSTLSTLSTSQPRNVSTSRPPDPFCTDLSHTHHRPCASTQAATAPLADLRLRSPDTESHKAVAAEQAPRRNNRWKRARIPTLTDIAIANRPLPDPLDQNSLASSFLGSFRVRNNGRRYDQVCLWPDQFVLPSCPCRCPPACLPVLVAAVTSIDQLWQRAYRPRVEE
jgi:hypothetical protein